MKSASGRSPASVEIATPARSKARSSLASGDSISKPGSSRPEIASTTRLTATWAGVPAAMAWIELAANRLRATRNGPRISSSAVIATQVNPLADASSAAASSRRVLPIPGSPSRVTAARWLAASFSSWEIASISALRPMIAPVPRRSWTASEHWGPTRGSSAPPSATRKDEACSSDIASPGMRRIMTEPSFNRGRASCRGPLPRVRPARFGASSDAWSRSSSVSPPSCDQPAVTTRLHCEKIANTLACDARRCQPERSLGT